MTLAPFLDLFSLHWSTADEEQELNHPISDPSFRNGHRRHSRPPHWQGAFEGRILRRSLIFNALGRCPPGRAGMGVVQGTSDKKEKPLEEDHGQGCAHQAGYGMVQGSPLPQIGWWEDANLTCLDQGRSKDEDVIAGEIALVLQVFPLPAPGPRSRSFAPPLRARKRLPFWKRPPR